MLDSIARTTDISREDPRIQSAALQHAANRLVVFDGGVIILNAYGVLVAAEPDRLDVLGQDWSNRAYFRQMLRTGGPVFSDINTDGPQGAEVIVVAMPILGGQGEFLGTLAGMFRLGATTVSSFYGSIVKIRIGGKGGAYLVDSHGRVIYHSNPDLIGQDLSTHGVVRQVLSGQVDAVRTQGLDGRDIVASFAPVPGTSWGLIETQRLSKEVERLAVMEERQRLARDLHDSVTQSLYSVTLYAEAAARLLASGANEKATDHLRHVRYTAQDALREMRLLIFELRPPILEKEGLVAALEARLEAVERRTGLQTELIVEGNSRLPPEIEEGLYRIALEALNNTLKHAQAHKVSVYLHQAPQLLTLEIYNDGIPFDPENAREQGGMGLRGMEERATDWRTQLFLRNSS